ncbi:MAG: type IV pilus assembly protein PilM [Candidatus Omnitrophota bacterium]
MKVVKNTLTQVKDLFSKSISEDLAPVGSLGVDIGSSAVKVVRLESTKDHVKLLGFGVEKIVDKNTREALSRALAKAKATPRQSAVVSVGGQGVVSRYIELPVMNKTELDSSMKFEIEKYVPFPLIEVACDYAVVHEMKDKAKMSVLIAAAKNELIQKKVSVAQEAGLLLKAIDLDCLALANFFSEMVIAGKKEACHGIVDMGRVFSSIDIFADGVPALSRDIFVGGDDITKKLAETMDLDYAQAEKLKVDPRGKERECLAVWESVLHNLAGEIRISLDYFEARANRTVDKIYIVGGAGRLLELHDYFGRLLGVDVGAIGAIERLKFEDTSLKEEFEKNKDLLAIALGLALR